LRTSGELLAGPIVATILVLWLIIDMEPLLTESWDDYMIFNLG
jgi:hypothetical protein